MGHPVMQLLGHPMMWLLSCRGLPILQQLKLEEQLLRKSSHNICIINDGIPSPSIVMGISGKPEQLINLQSVVRDQIPVIRRFSGGGTVIVDSDTIFVTLICNTGAVPNLQLYPRPIMDWTEQLYSSIFDDLQQFRLRENDYVYGDSKFGGNAQSIIKNRWLHHTSFLWDYKAENMAYLQLPSRTPKYRLKHSHNDFLCALKDIIHSRPLFLQNIVSGISRRFDVKEESIENLLEIPYTDFTCTTKLLSGKDLREQEACI